jgi:hypothetical protein
MILDRRRVGGLTVNPFLDYDGPASSAGQFPGCSLPLSGGLPGFLINSSYVTAWGDTNALP